MKKFLRIQTESTRSIRVQFGIRQWSRPSSDNVEVGSDGCRGRHCSAGVPGEPTEKERKEIGAGAARRRERNANTAAARYRVATGRTVVIQ